MAGLPGYLLGHPDYKMSQTVQPDTRNFLCDHCGGEIRISYDLPPTVAPCPHCSGEITSPPPPLPKRSENLAVAPPEEPEMDFASKEGRLEEGKEAEEKAAAEENAAERLAAEKVAAEKLERSVSVKEKAAPDDFLESEEAGSRSRAIPEILFLVAMLVLAGLVVGGVILLRSRGKDEPKPLVPEMDNARFIREGWKNVATEQLRGFLDAEGAEEKAKFVIGGSARVAEMEAFYSSIALDESDTPLDAFGHQDQDLVDREGGVFLMQYERPAQFDIREFFRTVETLEVRYDLEEADQLLSSVNKLQYFAMDPVKAMAFFKRDGNKLQLDWTTYVQTKYRTLKKFSGYPAAGTSGVFRVMLQEDIPDLSTGNAAAIRTYRAMDPGNSSDYVKVPVAENSEVGQLVSELKRVIFWEFLGLGGVEGNTETVTEPEELDPGFPVGESAVSEVAKGAADGVETPES